MSFIDELRRRNVVKVAIAYAVTAWVLIQIAATTFPVLHIPGWSVTLVTVLIIIGFPLALIFAWAFELTPEGIKLEKQVVHDESIAHSTGRKIDFVIIAMLVVALGFFAYDKFVLGPDRDAAEVEAASQVTEDQVVSAVAQQETIKTIAVLPFLNMSDDPDNEFFSDGISEEILNLLAKIPEMRVTSRSSAFSFKGQNADIPTIAAKLNVAHVLEGSVRKSGNQLRITVQLIEVATDTHLWSETYDRELHNIFAIQDEIAAAVADTLKIKLLGRKLKTIETDPEAYALYLQGRHFSSRSTADGYTQAERLLKQALKIDPDFAPGRTELASVYANQAGRFDTVPTDEGYELARREIERALDVDPQYGRAHAILATIELRYEFDFEAAARNLQQALALDSGNADILNSAARLNDTLGDVDKAIELMRQSIARDPVSAEGYYGLGRLYYRANRVDEAAGPLQTALSLNPEQYGAQYYSGLVLLEQGNEQAALEAMRGIGDELFRLTGTAIVQHVLGDARASDVALQQLIEKGATQGAYQIAEVYAFRGDINYAFEWLERAYDNRDSGLPAVLLNPSFQTLHDDPRWRLFLEKMGLPH